MSIESSRIVNVTVPFCTDDIIALKAKTGCESTKDALHEAVRRVLTARSQREKPAQEG